MSKFIGAHRKFGGEFVFDTETLRVIAIPITPPHHLWNDGYTQDWLAHQFPSKDNLVSRFVDIKPIPTFEFKGKTYFNRGEAEDGFRRIREVTKPFGSRHDKDFVFETGEDDESDS